MLRWPAIERLSTPIKKGSQCEPFVFAPGLSGSSGSGGQRLDLGRQAALVTRGLVLVEQALVGDRINHGLGGRIQFSCLGLVASDDSLLNVLDHGTELRTQ